MDIHKANPSIRSFLPPNDQLPEFIVDASLLKGKVNIIAYLQLKIEESGIWSDIALETDSYALTFRELFNRVNSIASALHSRGLKVGDRVLSLANFDCGCFEFMLGVMKAGGIVVSCMPSTDERVQFYLKDTLPAFVFINPKEINPELVLDHSSAQVIVSSTVLQNERIMLFEDLLRAPPTFELILTEGATVASMAYTSGSTGNPKGCVSTHASWIQALPTAPNHPFLCLERRSAVYLGLPVCGLALTLGVYGLFRGTKVIYSNDRGLPTVLRVLEKVGVTVLVTMPAIYNQIMQFAQYNPKWKESISLQISFLIS